MNLIYISIMAESKDFETVLVKDDRIANLTDKITYAVTKEVSK